MTFGRRLRQLRLDAQLTQEQLADALHMKKSTISMYENGRREPRELETLEAVADFFNVDMNTLFDKELPPESSTVSGRDILKALCKDSPQALALIDKMQVTESGEVTISGVDFTSAEIIGHALRGVLVALTRAKKTDDGNMEVVISLDAIFPPRDGGSR